MQHSDVQAAMKAQEHLGILAFQSMKTREKSHDEPLKRVKSWRKEVKKIKKIKNNINTLKKLTNKKNRKERNRRHEQTLPEDGGMSSRQRRDSQRRFYQT